ncbi:P-type conjugative transfer ATPase TrbB [Photobacterium damselae subsp. piscicida]|uniref:P-type conjugative transfer ATPase TrbB n=1 Tax=Photobacterium damselae TaxID=38293 RepID=UPI0010762E27|nr:P-type conjugative transfer ATPase TrbB [Photobacterium damselae]TFZ62416.1 P-type conjugative transfer ATPase TrbB [Photobacterium damselae subsp. piscicida]
MLPNDRITKSINYHLDRCGLTPFLHNDLVTEIMLNPNGQCWIEEFGKPYYLSHDIEPGAAQNLINAIADSVNVIVNKDNPILECELYTDGSRFEGIVPPVVPSVSFTIRKKATRVFSLEEYVENHILTQAQYDVIIEAVLAHKNIMVVGGTGSGKTTLVNAILAKMAQLFPHERHVVIEDTNELQPSAANSVTFRTHPKAGVGMRELLRATLRYNPDRIIIGEVRGGEALDLLKAWNTGHEGGIGTAHANSAYLGLERIEQCIEEVMPHANQRMIASTVHMLIYIEKNAHGRQVKEISTVSGFTEGRYLITQL